MLTTYYDTRSVANNTYVSKGQLSPYLTGAILTNSFILQTSLSNYKTNALVDAALNLRILKTSLTYNTDALLNAISSLTNYRTIT